MGITQGREELPKKLGCLRVTGTAKIFDPVEQKYLRAWNDMDKEKLMKMGDYVNEDSGFSVIWDPSPTDEQAERYKLHAEAVALKASLEQKCEAELAEAHKEVTLLKETGPAIKKAFQDARKALHQCRVRETDTMASLKLSYPSRYAEVRELSDMCHNVMHAVTFMTLAKGGGRNPLKPALKHLVAGLKDTEREDCAAMIFLLNSEMTNSGNSVIGMMAEFVDTFLAKFMQADDMKEEEASQWRECIMDRAGSVVD